MSAPPTFDSVEQLADELARVISTTPRVLIGIDGKDGTGKTTLARHIANRIGGEVVSLDDYLEKQKGSYIPHLRFEEIRRELSSKQGPIVLEGVCLLAAVKRIGITTDKLIYVKGVRRDGRWPDQQECDPKEPVDAVIGRLEEDLRAYRRICGKTTPNGTTRQEAKDEGLPGLVKEVIRYHASYRPLTRADYVFHRCVD
jgi:Cdc6-like AAA superfamily ATPase